MQESTCIGPIGYQIFILSCFYEAPHNTMKRIIEYYLLYHIDGKNSRYFYKISPNFGKKEGLLRLIGVAPLRQVISLAREILEVLVNDGTGQKCNCVEEKTY